MDELESCEVVGEPGGGKLRPLTALQGCRGLRWWRSNRRRIQFENGSEAAKLTRVFSHPLWPKMPPSSDHDLVDPTIAMWELPFVSDEQAAHL